MGVVSIISEGNTVTTPKRIPTDVRDGLLKGRIQPTPQRQQASIVHMAFDDALAAATIEDLLYAANLIIRHSRAKRTHRDARITGIAKRMDELRHGILVRPKPLKQVTMTPERVAALRFVVQGMEAIADGAEPEYGDEARAACSVLNAMLNEA